MKKLSKEKINKIKMLRENGLSHREISDRLKIALTTVFYYARDVKSTESYDMIGKLLREGVENKKRKTENKKKLSPFGFLSINGKTYAFVNLPSAIRCPHCQKEVKQLGYSFDSNKFFCIGEGIDKDTIKGTCGMTIDLRTAQRKEELAIK